MLFAAVATRIEGRKDDDLLTEYGFRGFPSLAVLDASGKAIVKNFGRSVSAMQKAVGETNDFLKMRATVAAGGKYDKKAWFLLQLKLSQLTGDEAMGCAAELGLKGDEAKEIDSKIFTLQVTEMMAADKPTYGAKVYKWLKAGRSLSSSAGRGQQNYIKMKGIIGAMAAGDAKIYEFCKDTARNMHQQRIRRVKSILPRVEPARKRFAGQPKILAQIDADVKRFKEQLTESEAVIKSMDEFEAKLETKTDGN